MNKKKVLIVGTSAKEYALAKVLSRSSNIAQVYIAPGNIASADFAQRVDIREDAVQELVEFAIKEEIDLTIASSAKAIKADIASFFLANSQLIFAPTAESANFSLSRGIAKKFMYKLHIPTPKFGIFEKQQLALDYLKNLKEPQLITTDFDSENSIRSVCVNINLAKMCIEDVFQSSESRVIIEDYAYGHTFTFYIITDGYHALPIAAVADYKFLEDGNAGLFTAGMGGFLPDYRISTNIESDIMTNVVSPLLTNLEKQGKPYLGILGVECVLGSDQKYVVTGFTPFLKEHDAQAVLNFIDTDLYSVFEACAVGSFADDYDFAFLPVKDLSIVSGVLLSRKEGAIITGLELVDDSTDVSHFATTKNNYFEYLTNKGRTLVLTQTASTLSRARELLYDNINEIYFDGIKYRHDICAE